MSRVTSGKGIAGFRDSDDSWADLSYTSFSIQWLDGRAPQPLAHSPNPLLAPSSPRPVLDSLPDEHVLASYAVNVTNTGKVVSDCVVLGFVRATDGSHAHMPRARLFEFTRLHDVKPAESRTVHFAATAGALRFTGADGSPVLAAAGRLAVEMVADVTAAPLRHVLDLASAV